MLFHNFQDKVILTSKVNKHVPLMLSPEGQFASEFFRGCGLEDVRQSTCWLFMLRQLGEGQGLLYLEFPGDSWAQLIEATTPVFVLSLVGKTLDSKYRQAWL